MKKENIQSYFESLQDSICSGLESLDGKAQFREDVWTRSEGGGGKTRVIEYGAVFEKGGVNTSAVWGKLPDSMAQKMDVPPSEFFATGISLVLHPLNPMVPTVHMNLRYFELGIGSETETIWFGGGTDLTPYYLFEEDVRHFHTTLKSVCDRHNPDYYRQFKKWCDEYFFIKHRNETRGVGGIFFDYLKGNPDNLFLFVKDIGNTFLAAYVPIVRRRRDEPFGEREKKWQLIRRGRYVEYNLVYDRGTLFGLETNGRAESILMSLPPSVAWEYNYHPEPGSREEVLLNALHPRDWV
jgi:coproporphyrinogen III oxidase